ncbi:hypothetical protein C8J57DRAFT_1727290 [Mycena rebaudengoi]|nr:hypothetical protein C8J57DRAFT_1727290 [Mycena rebaudengoi]
MPRKNPHLRPSRRDAHPCSPLSLTLFGLPDAALPPCHHVTHLPPATTTVAPPLHNLHQLSPAHLPAYHRSSGPFLIPRPLARSLLCRLASAVVFRPTGTSSLRSVLYDTTTPFNAFTHPCTTTTELSAAILLPPPF